MELEYAKGRFDESVPERYDTPFFTVETPYGPVGVLLITDAPDSDSKVASRMEVWSDTFMVSGKGYTGSTIYTFHPGTYRLVNEKGELHVGECEVLTAQSKPAPPGAVSKWEEVAVICVKQVWGMTGIFLQALLYRRFLATREAKAAMDNAVAEVRKQKGLVEHGKAEIVRIVKMIEMKSAATDGTQEAAKVKP